MMRYAGICYDGPREGRHYVWHRPEFQLSIVPALPVVDLTIDPDGYVPIYQGTYRWSEPLQKWVWLG